MSVLLYVGGFNDKVTTVNLDGYNLNRRGAIYNTSKNEGIHTLSLE